MGSDYLNRRWTLTTFSQRCKTKKSESKIMLNRDVDLSLELFRRQYLQLVELQALTFPNLEDLRDVDIQRALYESLFKPDSLQYAPPERYQIRVLKELISLIENSIVDPDEDDILDDLVSYLANLLTSSIPSETGSAQQKTFVTYTVPGQLSYPPEDRQTLTMLESRSLIASSGTTGLRTWEAALHLATYLMSPKGSMLVKNKNVLELGAGTGFLSILCAKFLEAALTLATDGSQEVVEDMKNNIFLNGLDDQIIKSKLYRWGQILPHRAADDQGQAWDVVLGADITFDTVSLPHLASSFSDIFLLSEDTLIIVAATMRNTTTIDNFISVCHARRFRIQDIDCHLPEAKDQTGFFHPTSPEIRLFSIHAPEVQTDPFAS
ncbi:MAG: hypothetical protein M1833_005590 [Piccolia ochrophora]|nr:MAG: hypothetical protein M1833_005590 [Piccolia ochrophora]